MFSCHLVVFVAFAAGGCFRIGLINPTHVLYLLYPSSLDDLHVRFLVKVGKCAIQSNNTCYLPILCLSHLQILLLTIWTSKLGTSMYMYVGQTANEGRISK
ncbi:hypothetical protein F5Y06DRAFT_166384 [Hypoxylon sp. FL0890]|nr:hypothetical protein F5Y06DRAFT_166384 [Hypoxylon sp. FL0890]